jgi:hypothetical protein
MSDRKIDFTLNPTSTAGSLDKAIEKQKEALEKGEIPLVDTTEKKVGPSEKEIKEFQARVARVYERGLIVDRLHVDLPPDLHGEWFPNEPGEIARAELLGFNIDTEHAPKRKLNDKADGSAIIGDVIFMVQPRWQRDIIEKKRAQIYYETHLKKRQKEESDFLANQSAIGEAKNSNVNSVAEVIPGHEISERLVNTQS